jgi:hypothetical protein
MDAGYISNLLSVSNEKRFRCVSRYIHVFYLSEFNEFRDKARKLYIKFTLVSASGFDPRRGQRIFPLASVSRPALGPTQHPVQWVPGVLSPGVKTRPGRDVDHSPPSSAEVENE